MSIITKILQFNSKKLNEKMEFNHAMHYKMHFGIIIIFKNIKINNINEQFKNYI